MIRVKSPLALSGATAPHDSLASLALLGRRQLTVLCPVPCLDVDDVLGVFDALAQSWGSNHLSDGPRWPSDISGDHTPYELSVAFDRGAPELRVMAEASGSPPSRASNLEAARKLNETLARRYGVDLGRIELLSDL